MSTKTTIKRIALVAVSALGFGMLSAVSSTAAITSAPTVTVTNGSAELTAGTTYETSTAALIQVNALATTSADTVSVTVTQKSKPTSGGSVTFSLGLWDTATAGTKVTRGVGAASLVAFSNGAASTVDVPDSVTAFTVASTGYIVSTNNNSITNGYMDATFFLQAESTTAQARVKGDYVYTVVVSYYNNNAYVGSVTKDVTVTINDLATNSLTVAPAKSTSFINDGTGTSATADAVVTAVATASNTTRATITVRTYNASDGAAPESITATLTGSAGLLCDSTGAICGTSLKLAGTGTSNILVRSNGVAGTATINVSTTTITFAPKTVTFYAKSPTTITASVYNPVLQVGTNGSAVAATAVDSNGTNWSGSLYIVASSATDALVGGSATAPVACTYNATYKTHFCPITTKATGTAKFKVVDKTLATTSTYAAADSAATSNEVTVTVSNAAPATVKLAFDKATYQPYERALITVTVLDKDGKTLQGTTYANLFATGGITSTQAFGSASDTLTAVSVATSTANGTDATAGAKTYIVYMPAQGTVTIKATGGTSLAAAGQVAVEASAEVINDSVTAATDAANEATDAANAATDAANAAAEAADAATAAAQDAQAAVAALATQVASLIAGIKAQITSLTNLVIKIQKKVKA